MSNDKDARLAAMLAQYEGNTKPKFEKKDAKVYDLKNYFNTFIEKGVNTATKTIRILPTSDNTSPFVEMWGHKAEINGEWKTLPCLKEEKNEACPFCEARDVLVATGTDANKELAKKYKAKLMFIVKVIDRDDKEGNVKFWRFNQDWRKEGVMDKISSITNALKKDITDAETGRDLVITIQRNQNGVPIVSGIAQIDPSPLSTNAAQQAEWLADSRTWEDVYSVRNYDYMEIVVKGGVPVWDKDEKKFVDKNSIKPEGGDGLEAELTMGVENVKAGVTAATDSPSAPVAESDDLPF